MNYLLTQSVDNAADRTPERAAVGYAGASLTWSALARRSNGLARILVAHGVRRGDRVGLFMNKSLDSAVAMHGVMKAGGAYVPLDPFAPAARTALVIRDCGIRHVITTDLKLDQTVLLDEDIAGV